MEATETTRQYGLVLVEAGISDPSSTNRLGEQVLLAAQQSLTDRGAQVQTKVIHLKGLAVDIASAVTGGTPSSELQNAIDTVAGADGIIAATPVFKASYAGLFKAFWDVLDPDDLVDKPVALAATAGSVRHALVPDVDMRPLFTFFRAVVTPTSVMAAPSDFGSPALQEREHQVGHELGVLVFSGIGAHLNS